MLLRRLQAEGFKHLRGIDLVFPPKGTFLIQGGNEAGKSSLFEVVFFTLFGKPLQVRSTEDLLGYGLTEAKTYIELEIGEDILKIERTIRKNRVNTVKVVIGEEIITTAREANRRILEELHLDADTLLNSCFVEQKALEKLEGLDRSARESAVMKLLNLDRMQAIEEELKVKREDERQLQEWDKKRRIAEINEEMPRVRKDIEHYERLRGFSEAENLTKEAESYKKLAEEEAKKLPPLEKIRNELQRKVQELHKLRDKEHKLDNILNSLRFLREKETHIESLNKQLEEIEKAKESIPELEKKRGKTQTLLNLYRRLNILEGLFNKASNWLSLKNQIADEKNKIAILNEELQAKLEQIEKNKQDESALRVWLDCKVQEEKLKRIEKITWEISRLSNLTNISFVVAPILFLILFFLSPIKWLSAIALIPFIGGVIFREKKQKSTIELAKLKGEVGNENIERLREIESKLMERGLTQPATIEEAEGILKKEQEELRILQEDERRLRNDIAMAEGKIEMWEKRLASEFPEIPASISEEEVKKRVDKMEQMLTKWKMKIEKIASEFALPSKEDGLKEMLVSLNKDIKNSEALINKEPEALISKRKDEEEIKKLREEMEKAASGLREEVRDIFSREEWERIKTELKKQRDKLEREEVEKKLEEAIGKLKAQEQKVTSYIENAEKLEKKAKELLSHLGEPPEHLPTLEEINNMLDDRRAELRRLEKEFEILREQIIGDVPPLEQCKMEYEKLAKELKVRELSATILAMARQNITKKILPRTIERMWDLLPLLTNDRYRQVELNEENFKIRVYDERAGDWKDKNIFSGGTRDQMSLALRLAFALAALPEERGTAPRFLFLDEPLSSFDEQRREALIRVITEGEIAEAFDQIFVISHTPLLNPNLFHYYIVMENGKIKECSEELIPPEKRKIHLL